MEGLQERLGRLAIIGGGQMGEAIVSGLVHGALFNAAEIQVIEPVAEQRQNLEERYGIECSADVSELDNPQSILMAVKPQIFREVAASLAALPSIAPERVISIAAGVPTTLICEYFPDIAVIRVMPNIALKVSAGMSVVANAAGTPLREAELVAELFGLMGEATVIDEAQINAATAISGSGPAYFALVVEHLAACGIAAGLSEELAWQLARQTVIGTGRYLELLDVTPAQLRQAVTSPKGTTEAALEAFAAGGLEQSIQQGFAACVRRAEELA